MNRSIEVRSATLRDAVALVAIYKPYVENTAVSFEYEAPSAEEFAVRIQKIQRKYPYLVAEDDGELLGYAYANSFKERAAYDWAVEMSIYVKLEKKRMGIGSMLYEALEQRLKEQGILNLNACIAYSQEENEYLTRDSITFHEKMGYRFVGQFHQCGYKFQRWYDMIWMEKHIGDHLKIQPAVKFNRIL